MGTSAHPCGVPRTIGASKTLSVVEYVSRGLGVRVKVCCRSPSSSNRRLSAPVAFFPCNRDCCSPNPYGDQNKNKKKTFANKQKNGCSNAVSVQHQPRAGNVQQGSAAQGLLHRLVLLLRQRLAHNGFLPTEPVPTLRRVRPPCARLQETFLLFPALVVAEK